MLKTLKKIWDNPCTLWFILAIPSLMMLRGALNGGDLERLLHPSGEFSARLMIIAMMLTPLVMLFPKATALKWLIRRRRYLGVAAFGYALLHTIFYLVDLDSLPAILADVLKLSIWTGWLAFLIFIPMAITSFDGAMQSMGRNWKRLQRLVYIAAVATLLHWIFVHNNLGPALVHFLPLALLEIYRIWKTKNNQRKFQTTKRTARRA